MTQRLDTLFGELRSIIHSGKGGFKAAADMAMSELGDADDRVTAAKYLNGVKHDSDFDIATHNGKITLQNPRTLNHKTFRVWTERWKRNGIETRPRVLSLKVGNEKWQPFAFVDNDGGVRVWRRFRDSKEHTVYAALLTDQAGGEAMGLLYHCKGRSRVCNRALTDPHSDRLGIGPICRGDR